MIANMSCQSFQDKTLIANMSCDCGDRFALYKGSDNRTYESQTDEYRCGPVAIRNALRFVGAVPGPATRRRVCAVCCAVPRHPCGFGGTLPSAMTGALRLVFRAEVAPAVGASACRSTLLTPEYMAFIVLYSDVKAATRKRYYHYVFMVRRRGYFYAQNEMDKEEYKVPVRSLEAEYLQEVLHCGVQFPQVWTLPSPTKACVAHKK